MWQTSDEGSSGSSIAAKTAGKPPLVQGNQDNFSHLFFAAIISSSNLAKTYQNYDKKRKSLSTNMLTWLDNLFFRITYNMGRQSHDPWTLGDGDAGDFWLASGQGNCAWRTTVIHKGLYVSHCSSMFDGNNQWTVESHLLLRTAREFFWEVPTITWDVVMYVHSNYSTFH